MQYFNVSKLKNVKKNNKIRPSFKILRKIRILEPCLTIKKLGLNDVLNNPKLFLNTA